MDWADRNYKIWEGSTREMDMIQHTIENISNTYKNPVISTSVICSVLVMALLIGLYEFAVYRLVSHRAFYNRSFNICTAILPLFISTIILCLQSNIVITLGTIGALAILRFRTAVKDPVDMLYLFCTYWHHVWLPAVRGRGADIDFGDDHAAMSGTHFLWQKTAYSGIALPAGRGARNIGNH